MSGGSMYNTHDFLSQYKVYDSFLDNWHFLGTSVQDMTDYIAYRWKEELSGWDFIKEKPVFKWVNVYLDSLILDYNNPHDKRYAFYCDDKLINPLDYCSLDYLKERYEYLLEQNRADWERYFTVYGNQWWRYKHHPFRFRIDPVPFTGNKRYRKSVCRTPANLRSKLKENSLGLLRRHVFVEAPFIWDDRLRKYDRSWKSCGKHRHQWQKNLKEEP